MLSALFPRLRTVVLPQATLPLFPSIASANSAWNLKTCGLLLGTRRVFIFPSLFPQHTTSDTCPMSMEEGVLGFTEERGPISDGYIHTHLTQSCFMSSVDLHTHASFQRMPLKSFAVMSAPKGSQSPPFSHSQVPNSGNVYQRPQLYPSVVSASV
ncbi:hypothetical protein DFH09DRAFT_1019349 [Mycena vulgaris]|nr:hypothetical protein DFH09DRAFT_1019349 [Mycena vulgaris]